MATVLPPGLMPLHSTRPDTTQGSTKDRQASKGVAATGSEGASATNMAINSKCLLLTGSGTAGDIFNPTKRPSYLKRSWPCDLLSLSSYVESDCGHSYHATWDVRATQSFGSDEELVSAKFPRWTVSRKRALNSKHVGCFWIHANLQSRGLQSLSQRQCNSNCAPKKRAMSRQGDEERSLGIPVSPMCEFCPWLCCETSGFGRRRPFAQIDNLSPGFQRGGDQGISTAWLN